MKTLKKGKFMAFLATCVMVASMGMSVTASATQSRADYFNKGYSQGNNPASNMVAVANAQLGKTGSQLRYTEEWCADFTTDVARLAKGVGDNVIPYNYGSRGRCIDLYRYMKSNCRAKDVATSQAQVGDIIFFDWSRRKNTNNIHHVGIVVSNRNGRITMVGGNQGNGNLYSRRVTQATYGTGDSNICRIVRPNYSGSNNNNNNSNNNSNSNNSSNKTGTYTVRSNSGATVRTGPGTGYSKAGGGIAKGSVITYDKTANANGYTWYHITKVSAKPGTWGKNVGYWIANV